MDLERTKVVMQIVEKKEEKLKCVQQLSDKFDDLKCLIELLWEIGELNKKRCSDLSQLLALIGQMIGGWLELFKEKPALNNAGNQDAGGGRANRTAEGNRGSRCTS